MFPVSVKVATRLFVDRSITLAAPEELFTTRKVKFEPVSEQNCAVEPCGGTMICVLSSNSRSALGDCAQLLAEYKKKSDNPNRCLKYSFTN